MSQTSKSSSQNSSTNYGSESDFSQRSFDRTQLLFTESQAREEDRLRDARQDELIRQQAAYDEDRRKQEQNQREASERYIKDWEEYEALIERIREDERRKQQEIDDDALMCKALAEHEALHYSTK